MRGAARSMQFMRPADTQAALRDYARHPDALPFAGGTDIMVDWNAGLLLESALREAYPCPEEG